MKDTAEEKNKLSATDPADLKTFGFLSKSAVVSVLIGGFLGTATRALIFIFMPSMVSDVVVNVVGSFFVGFLMFLPALRNEPSNDHSGEMKINKRLFIGTGFLGGFTTFSYFMLSPFLSVMDGTRLPTEVVPSFTWDFIVQFSIYVTVVAVLGVIAAAVGKYIAQNWFCKHLNAAPNSSAEEDARGMNDAYDKGDNLKGVS